MRKIAKLLVLATAALSLFTSCADDNNPSYAWLNPNMLVTVKSASDGSVYFQLDDKTTLLPVNIKTWGKTPVRALAACDMLDRDASPYDKAVEVHWIEPVLTKATVETKGSAEEDDKAFGRDPVEIVSNWVSLVEDGYLTLNFRAYFGNMGIAHYVNLVTGVDPDDPYTVEFRHDAKGDMAFCDLRGGVAAFDLKSLPDTEGKTVKLTVRYRSLSSGDVKTLAFDYCTGASSLPDKPVPSNIEAKLAVE